MWRPGGGGRGVKCERLVVGSLRRTDPTEWKLVAYDGFFREENIVVLESTFHSCVPSSMRKVILRRGAS